MDGLRASRRWLRGYFWRAQLLQLGVVVVLMLALCAACSTVAYLVGHAQGWRHKQELDSMANNVFSDYLASGQPFVVDGKTIQFVSRPTYDTYKVKHPTLDPKQTGMGGR